MTFFQSGWTSDEQGLRPATREQLMDILADVEYILLKSKYDPYQREVRLV